MPEFLGCHGELAREAYLCDLHHTAAPKTVLQSPGHVTVTDFNDKQTNLLAAGAGGGDLYLCDVLLTAWPQVAMTAV